VTRGKKRKRGNDRSFLVLKNRKETKDDKNCPGRGGTAGKKKKPILTVVTGWREAKRERFTFGLLNGLLRGKDQQEPRGKKTSKV